MTDFVIRGDICYSKNLNELNTFEGGYLVCKDNVSKGVFREIPEEYKNFEVLDYSKKLIIPGLTDLHVHAPQYYYRGLGLDMELIDWLNAYTFPNESKYKDEEFAKASYQEFVKGIVKSPNTRSVVFSTLQVSSTIILMDLLEKSGIISYVGKVNMDRNSIEELREKDAFSSAEDTKKWISCVKSKKYERTFPILTPRFVPSCSDELLNLLKDIKRDYKLPLQSHLSENKREIEWVKELCPYSSCYADVYKKFDLLGQNTIMAHCVLANEEEQKILKESGTFIAHCPNSNLNLASGIAPAKKYLYDNQKIGLGSDVAGGTHLSILRAMSDAIQASKMYWRYIDEKYKPLTVEEVFYMGTVGGGNFFGKVGSFEKDFEFDAVVLDDKGFSKNKNLNLRQRLEAAIYLSEDECVIHKFVGGKMLF